MKKWLLKILSLISPLALAARTVQVDELRQNNAANTLLATATELSYLAGSTANIQSQINSLGTPSFPLATKSADYTMTASDSVIICDTSGGPVDITLPVAASAGGKIFNIKRVGANTCDVLPQGISTIDGASSQSLATDKQSVTLTTDLSDWFIL